MTHGGAMTQKQKGSCGHTGYMWSARYPDATCVDGYLWDLDSLEFGTLQSGGDLPCPACNTHDWLDHHMNDLTGEGMISPASSAPAEKWERIVQFSLETNRTDTIRALARLEPFTLTDRPGRVASPEIPDPNDSSGMILRTWPWPVTWLSEHERAYIAWRKRSGRGVPEMTPGQQC